jgi:hypothetical protein
MLRRLTSHVRARLWRRKRVPRGIITLEDGSEAYLDPYQHPQMAVVA